MLRSRWREASSPGQGYKGTPSQEIGTERWGKEREEELKKSKEEAGTGLRGERREKSEGGKKGLEREGDRWREGRTDLEEGRGERGVSGVGARRARQGGWGRGGGLESATGAREGAETGGRGEGRRAVGRRDKEGGEGARGAGTRGGEAAGGRWGAGGETREGARRRAEAKCIVSGGGA